MTGIIVSASTVSSTRRNNNNKNNMNSRGTPHKRTGLRPLGPPSRRTKQISHESTSSFFTTVTTASSSVGAEAPPTTATTAVRRYYPSTPLPKATAEHHKSHEEDDSPKRTVHYFVAYRQAGNIEAAATLLDDKVQVSYPQLPYCKSAAEWKRLGAASLVAMDTNHAWQVLQTGAHAAQVVRRGSVRGRREAVIEVFELHQNSSSNNNQEWVIGAMYLRRAPRQWTLWGGGKNNKKKQLRRLDNKTLSKENRLSIPSQRLQREMVQGDVSEHEYYCGGGGDNSNNQDAYYSYYDSSEDYYSYGG